MIRLFTYLLLIYAWYLALHRHFMHFNTILSKSNSHLLTFEIIWYFVHIEISQTGHLQYDGVMKINDILSNGYENSNIFQLMACSKKGNKYGISVVQ